MCGTEYCGTCEADARANGVEDWARGLRHDRPHFGDYAQQCVATRRRIALLRSLMVSDPAQALRFPEFLAHGEPAIQVKRFAKRARHVFGELQVLVPDFGRHVQDRPLEIRVKGTGKAARKLRAQALKRWQRDRIFAFLAERNLPMLIEMHQKLGWNVPQWITTLPALEDPVQALPLAA